MELLKYVATSTACLSLAYLGYLVISNNESNFKLLRFILLCIVILSLLTPFSSIHININLTKNNADLSFLQNIETGTFNSPVGTNSSRDQILYHVNWFSIITTLYLLVSVFFLLRFLYQLVKIFELYYKLDKEKYGGYQLIYTKDTEHSFSFFKWIFIPGRLLPKKIQVNKIIAHEKTHASQYHSIDMVLIELLSAVMWFNPFVWMMRSSFQTVHEYLADEGALSTGIDKEKYQALLLNLAAEAKIIRLSSGFNQSLIKKRIIMMTKSKTSSKKKTKIFALFPIAAGIFFIVACANGIEESLGTGSDSDAKIVTTDTDGSVKIRRINSSESGALKDPTYIVDGVEADNIEDIDPNSIKSISVLKEENKIVVETGEKKAAETKVQVRSKNTTIPENILFIVEGVEYTKEEFNNKFTPNEIFSIDVLKGESGKEYIKGRDFSSVILVSTK